MKSAFFPSFALFLAVNIAVAGSAQQRANGTRSSLRDSTGNSSRAGDNLAPTGGSATGVGGNASTSTRVGSPDDDHIACELTEENLLKLRPRPEQPTLNDVQAEQLKRQVIQAVAQASGKGAFPRVDEFLDWLLYEPLTGLTLAQGQNRIFQELAHVSPPSEDTPVPSNNKDLIRLKAEVQTFTQDTATALGTNELINKLKNDSTVTYGELKQLQAALDTYISLNGSPDEIRTASDTFNKVADVMKGTSDNFLSFYDISPRLQDDLRNAQQRYQRWSEKHPDWESAVAAACDQKKDTQKDCTVKQFKAKAAQLQGLLSNKDLQAVADVNGNSLLISLNPSIFKLEEVAEAAHKAISAFAKPDDVGCAMTILPWNTMRYSFGQRVADEFLGVQITVRNLNAEKEFLLHDAELAVDIDIASPKPRHSRFFSGVDKQNVRAYMLAARDYDNRSVWVHSAEGIATLFGSAAPIWGGAVTDASSVFAGGFLPAMTHVWTDHHTDQLNELNDVGFSASRNDRTFVPKSGSTQFVIFVPVKPLEEAWWTQSCVQAIPLGTSQKTDTSPTGIDVEALRRICIAELAAAKTRADSSATPNSVSSDKPTVTLEQTGTGEQSIAYFKPSRTRYQKWSPTTYELLKELSFAVVAGTHVTLNSDTHPDITQVDCPHTSVGDIDFFAAKSGSITCNLSGVNLDKADHITLRSATDTQTVDSSIKAGNGGKVAMIDLKIADLCALNDSAYKLYTVTGNGIEDGGTQSLHLSLEPFLTEGPSPNSVATGPVNLTLKGCHLDRLQSIQLGDSSIKSNVLVVSNQEPSSASVEPGGQNNANVFMKWQADIKAGKSVVLDVWLISTTDQSNPKDSKQTVTVTGP